MPSHLRKRKRRVPDFDSEDAENIPILTEGQQEALNAELPANGVGRKILAELQENISQLKEAERELKAELATRKKPRTRSTRITKKTDEDFGVGDAARWFVINGWLFVPNPAWMVEDIEKVPDDDPNTATHNVPKKKFILDYINALPPSVREDYREDDVRSVFNTDLGNMRSMKVHDVKHVAYKLFDLSIAEYITCDRSLANEETLPRIHCMLGFKPRNPNDPKSKDTYSVKPPFIFGDGDSPQAERLFRVEALAKALRVILFGPSSLNGPSVANNDTYGKMWGVKKTTPPLIACATTMINYLLSPDKEFTPTGKYSRMEYSERYVRYRNWAASLESFEAGRETLKFWDSIVFAGITTDSGDAAEEGEDEGDILRELQEAAAAEAARRRLEEAVNSAEPNADASAQPTFNDPASGV